MNENNAKLDLNEYIIEINKILYDLEPKHAMKILHVCRLNILNNLESQISELTEVLKQTEDIYKEVSSLGYEE